MKNKYDAEKSLAEKEVVVDGEHLTIDQIVSVARYGTQVKLHHSLRNKIATSRDYVEQAVHHVMDPKLSDEEKKDWLIYGVTTGFGCHKDYTIKNEEEARNLQRNILLSHACGVGPFFDSETVRAILLLRLNSFAKGFSGVRFELMVLLMVLLNNRIHPLVPEKGSVGSSGDLCPLAHTALVLIGRGMVKIDEWDEANQEWAETDIMEGSKALELIRADLQKHGISLPFEVSFKEGLALTNGATVMTAIGVLAYHDAVQLVKHADVAGALSLEAIGGRTRAFDHKVHNARPFAGQRGSAKNVRRLVDGSCLVNKNEDIHDAYSIRCIPQVHGASRDALDYVKKVLDVEINSATDNPLFFEPDPEPDDGLVEKRDYSAGNFHGQPIALAMDFMGLAVAEIGCISERRIQKLLDKHHNYGLNSNLTVDPRVNSGFMLSQYTAASLVSENKVLCHPASCDSIPTSANIEDHVSMGTIAARKARTILENVENVIGIELLCAAQALDFRHNNLPSIDEKTFKGQSGKGTQAALKAIRGNNILPLKYDRELYPDIEKAKKLIENQKIIDAVEKEIGPLA